MFDYWIGFGFGLALGALLNCAYLMFRLDKILRKWEQE